MLGALGVELALNSPNARRRDFLYALSDRPARRVGGEKLGWPYGKRALEWEWGNPTALKREAIAERVEEAVTLRNLDELGELARLMEALKEPSIESISDIDRQIGRLEHDLETAADPRSRTAVTERLVRFREARHFAAEHGMLPATRPKPARERKPRPWSEPKHDHYSSSSHSSSHHQSIDHGRGSYSR